MKKRRLTLSALLVSGLVVAASSQASGEVPFEADAMALVEGSCIRCHGETTETPLNFEKLGFDLADRDTFKTWVRVFERLQNGEMPPGRAPKPSPGVVEAALGALKGALVEANLEVRAGQRTPLRRLTRLEYQYTVQDLLRLDPEFSQILALSLPAEADSGGFDTVAAIQGVSSLHVRSYLEAAERALDEALQVGPRPETLTHRIDYPKSLYLNSIANGKFVGAGVVKVLDDAVAMFLDAATTYTMHTEKEGYVVPRPGRYRVTAEAYPYQATTPVTLTMYRGEVQGAAAALSDLIGSFDLVGSAPRTVELSTYLQPGQLIAPSMADVVPPPGDYVNYFAAENNVKDYVGEGIAMKWLTVEGPLFESWPLESTQELLVGVGFDEMGEVQLTKDAYEHVVDVVANFAPRAFRRPLQQGELDAYASLAQPALEGGQSFIDAVRVPLRAILSAPPFVYHVGQPGKLDDFGLATRLSYFLWRSLPDDELFAAAQEGRLSDPEVISQQVDRMLDDARSQRFVGDFVGQAFRLYELNSTAPDKGLYPEFDSQLGQAMALETELFLAELVAEDLSLSNLIDSDFTFVNRRLAEHYDIPDVEGQHMRRIELPADSVRGGLLTQASIHKVTANGTTTSPVPRGNFVLANLFGKPAPPPPTGVEGLEPDTRGAMTIREQLDKHRSEPVCNSCHSKIDPPGFALESFDPIGGFRTNYRLPGDVVVVDGVEYPAGFREGLPVDITGTTPQGDTFSGIEEYKRLLLENDVDQVARHMVSQLLVFATGAQIEFADHSEVERIRASLEDRGYPFRTLIHEIAKSSIFGSL